jgi:hypothetical protein
MTTTPLRCAVVFLLVGFALALDSQLSAQTPVRRLEVEQTSAGPVVHGMFRPLGRSTPVRSMPLCGNCHCNPGSHNPQGCESPTVVIPQPQCSANPSCTYYKIASDIHGGCSCLCTIFTGQCNGCITPGYCSGSECAAGSVIP